MNRAENLKTAQGQGPHMRVPWRSSDIKRQHIWPGDRMWPLMEEQARVAVVKEGQRRLKAGSISVEGKTG